MEEGLGNRHKGACISCNNTSSRAACPKFLLVQLWQFMEFSVREKLMPSVAYWQSDWVTDGQCLVLVSVYQEFQFKVPLMIFRVTNRRPNLWAIVPWELAFSCHNAAEPLSGIRAHSPRSVHRYTAYTTPVQDLCGRFSCGQPMIVRRPWILQGHNPSGQNDE